MDSSGDEVKISAARRPAYQYALEKFSARGRTRRFPVSDGLAAGTPQEAEEDELRSSGKGEEEEERAWGRETWHRKCGQRVDAVNFRREYSPC
jgi:hypothetical protein